MNSENKNHSAKSIFQFIRNIPSAVYLILGIILLLYPQATGKLVCYAAGICSLLYGLFHFIRYKKTIEETGVFKTDLISGIILTAIGIFTLFFPSVILSILPFMLGIIILLDGLPMIQQAFALKKAAFHHWWITMVFSVCITIFGILLIINPFSAAIEMMRFLGITLFIDGIAGLWIQFRLTHRK